MDLSRTRHSPWKGLFLVAGLVACGLCPASAQIYIEPDFLKWFVGEESYLFLLNIPENVTDFSWYRGEHPSEDTRIISYQPPSNTWAPGPQFNSRVNVTTDGSLYFSQAEKNDTGNYTVRVATEHENQTTMALFQVGERLDNPVISVNTTSVVEYLDPVLFTCHTNATRVLWTIYFQEVSSNNQMTLSPDNKTLTLHWVIRYNNLVQCQIVNFKDETQRSESITLSVSYGPYQVRLESSPQNVFDTISAELGSKVEISCTSFDCQPSPKYRWTHNGAPLNYSGYNITLWSLSREQLGRYRCIMENPSTQLRLYQEVIVERPWFTYQIPSDFHLALDSVIVLSFFIVLGVISLIGILIYTVGHNCSTSI